VHAKVCFGAATKHALYADYSGNTPLADRGLPQLRPTSFGCISIAHQFQLFVQLDDSERPMTARTTVSSADFIRNIGFWQNEALRQPISITHHGRERLVLAAPDHFAAKSGDDDAQARDEVAALKAGAAAVLENMAEAFLAFDAQGRVRSVNGVAEALVGLARDEIKARPVFDTLPEPIASVLADRLQRVARTRRPESFECGAFEARQVAVRVFPLPEGVGALIHNQTEQHALRREREETIALEAAVRQLDELALIKLDARGRIEDVDAAFCRWTGFARAELAGHRFADLAAIGARRELALALERVLREGAAAQIELTLLGKKGDEVSGRLGIAPISTDFVARGAQAAWTRATVRTEAVAA